jgi:hypothetical protein
MKHELFTQVGGDGVLTLAIPLGEKAVNKIVRVDVETVEEETCGQAMSKEQWARFVQSMAGRISDPTFDRPPQGAYEQREELL